MKSLASLTVLAVVAIGSASASTIQFNTTGSTFSSNGTSTFTINSGPASAVFTYNQSQPVISTVSTPSGVNYGVLAVTYSGSGLVTIPSFQLNLRINNITDAASGTFVVTSSGGTVGPNSNTVVVSFAPVPLVVGTASFTANTPLNLVDPTISMGQTSFQGGVTIAGAPEPGTMFLLGAGLLGIGFTARKKFANRS